LSTFGEIWRDDEKFTLFDEKWGLKTHAFLCTFVHINVHSLVSLKIILHDCVHFVI
jgi:hypothetical protein